MTIWTKNSLPTQSWFRQRRSDPGCHWTRPVAIRVLNGSVEQVRQSVRDIVLG